MYLVYFWETKFALFCAKHKSKRPKAEMSGLKDPIYFKELIFLDQFSAVLKCQIIIFWFSSKHLEDHSLNML